MIITADIDCGNAPKMGIIRQLCISFAKGETEFMEEWLSEDAVWELVGSKTLGGLEAIIAQTESTQEPVKSMALKHVMSHGSIGAVDGAFETESGRSFSFCNLYEFAGHSKAAKIKQISSYVIELG